MSLLVADQRAVRGIEPIYAVFITGLPKHLIAAEERQVHFSIARRFHIGALVARPVLVLSRRDEHSVIFEQRAYAVGVNAGEISQVVAIGLQELHQLELG